jgi:hypothetical protein
MGDFVVDIVNELVLVLCVLGEVDELAPVVGGRVGRGGVGGGGRAVLLVLRVVDGEPRLYLDADGVVVRSDLRTN